MAKGHFMDEDNYPTPEANTAGNQAGVKPETEDQGEDEAPEATTALLPKTILGGKEFTPGQEVVLKIVHVYGDEVEVEYASESEPQTQKSMSADEEIDAMATETT